eukprot:83199_1
MIGLVLKHRLTTHCYKNHRHLNRIHRRYIFLSEAPTFDKDPTLSLSLPQYNACIDILTLSHWVDIQHFDQNKLNECRSLREWMESKRDDEHETTILLDICPNRLDYIYKYSLNNPKPSEISTEQINETFQDIEMNELVQTKTKKMKRLNEKIDRMDEIHKLKLINYANKVKPNKVLTEYKLTEPVFTEIDIWYFEFYWNMFEHYYKHLVPHFDEFKKEFYFNTSKLRFLNVIYGEEMMIVLDYFDPQHTIKDYNDTEYKYRFPAIRGIHSKNEFDQFMNQIETEKQTLMTTYRNKDENLKLIAAGMPVEFIYRKMQKLKKPMLWIEFAISIKNYFSDKHAQNLANQVPLICDIKEFIWTPHARNVRYHSWDSTLELNEMLSCVIPQFYDILVHQQSIYLFNNLLHLLKETQDKKNIVILTGQGVAQLLNQHILNL